MSEKLKALRAAFENKTNSGFGDQTWKLFYPFWKMEVGATAVVRFLPDLDTSNSFGFLAEKHTHELSINGKRTPVTCLGERCPICTLSRRYYDEARQAGETREAPGPLSKLGSKYYRKVAYVGQVIVIESPIEHDQTQLVKLIELGPQIFKQIQAGFQSGDLDEAPYEYKGGYNFRIRKTQTGNGQNNYSTSNFAPKQSDLDDEILELEQFKLYKLSDYTGKKLDYATVEAMLTADQTGKAYDDANGEVEVSATPTTALSAGVAAEATAGANRVTQTAEAKVEKTDPAPTQTAASKTADILARLQARSVAK